MGGSRQSVQKVALSELRERKSRYKGYLHELRQTDKTQILTTDPECHRMHTKDGFNCCYNVQAAVDVDSHLIAEYEATGNATDQGLLHQMAQQTKEALKADTLEVVADKGYDSRRDILECVMNGTIPNVALKYDKHKRVYPLDYIEAEIDEQTRHSKRAEDISACLRAGVLPNAMSQRRLP